MPTAKCKIPKDAGPRLSRAVEITLLGKGYTQITSEELAKLLDVTLIDANAIMRRALPSAEAIEKVCDFISGNPTKEPEQPIIQYEVEPWPVMNFSFRRAPHATRI